MKFKVVLEKEQDGRYSVHCPAIKGCHSYGDDKAEALKNIREAVQGCLEALNKKIKAQILFPFIQIKFCLKVPCAD